MKTEGSVMLRRRQVFRGVVVSDKMNKTRIIEISRTVEHGLYEKKMLNRSRFMFHDEKNESRKGDLVVIESIRTLSKNKNFKLVKRLETGSNV
jgi:small subunit ribosomal protein S17